jgi:hypothetical protein
MHLSIIRDLQLPVHEIRKRELGMNDKPDRAKNTVSLPALKKGNIGLVVATQIARFVEPGSSLPWMELSPAGLGANAGPAGLV